MAGTEVDKSLSGETFGVSHAPLMGGDFRLNSLSIISPSTNNLLHLDHPSVFQELNIYEDLFSNVIRGTFTFIDTQGWAELLPLIGDETLIISFGTPGSKPKAVSSEEEPDSTSSAEEANTERFKVYDCVETGTADKTKFYKIFFVSEEYVFSKKMKVSKGYKGNKFSSIVKDVMSKVNQKMSPELYKRLYVEDTKTLQNVIIPNWNPFQAINFCASRSLSSDIAPQDQTIDTQPIARPVGSLFVFYEKLGSGFYYESIESMILKQKAAGNIPLYQYRPKVAAPISIGVDYFGVEKFQIKSSFKSLENLSNGMFASKLIAYDPIRMKYDVVKYDYYKKTTFPETETLNTQTGHTQINSNVDKKDDSLRAHSNFIATDLNSSGVPNKMISTHSDYLGSNDSVIKLATTTYAHDAMFVAPPKAQAPDFAVRTSTIGVSNTTFKDQSAKPNHVENWLLQRQAQLSEFKNIMITFTVPGNTSRHVGDLIRFETPTHIPEDSNEYTPTFGHQQYSGHYIVSKIRHIITVDKHEMDMELIKNTFASRIPGQIDKTNLTDKEFSTEVAAAGGILT